MWNTETGVLLFDLCWTHRWLMIVFWDRWRNICRRRVFDVMTCFEIKIGIESVPCFTDFWSISEVPLFCYLLEYIQVPLIKIGYSEMEFLSEVTLSLMMMHVLTWFVSDDMFDVCLMACFVIEEHANWEKEYLLMRTLDYDRVCR